MRVHVALTPAEFPGLALGDRAAIVYHHLFRRDGVLRSMLFSDAPAAAAEGSTSSDLAPATR